MTLRGEAHERDWDVEVETVELGEAQFGCQVRVRHHLDNEVFEHAFQRAAVSSSEREAMLEGLRAGIVWIETKSRHLFSMRAPS